MTAVTADGAGTGTASPVLTPEILRLAAVVVLGSIMTIVDATIVNVALPTLGRDFHTSIATIQWVPTVYLLAFASVIPLTGWASERFGAKPVWLGSLAAFMAGSLLAGISWSIGALIAFRVVQGLAGGMIMPLGQTILAQVAGPRRMGRVMSIVGVPMLLAPVVGPVIGAAPSSAVRAGGGSSSSTCRSARPRSCSPRGCSPPCPGAGTGGSTRSASCSSPAGSRRSCTASPRSGRVEASWRPCR
jgi:Major Facilitator Superfamily